MALFDLDNTLVDRSAFRRWAHGFVRERDLEDWAVDYLCLLDDDGLAPRVTVFRGARDRFSLASSVDELILHYRQTYPLFHRPDPNVLLALGSLRAAGWRVGIVTNGPPSQIDKIERSGLRPYIDAWAISDDVGYAKPDPRLFMETIRRCGGDASSPTWMIGDTAATDIDGGRRAGCRTIWLRHGREWDIRGYTPDAVVDTVADAIRVVLTMTPEPDLDVPRPVDA